MQDVDTQDADDRRKKTERVFSFSFYFLHSLRSVPYKMSRIPVFKKAVF
jgi:hypothetical protein